MKYLNKDYKYDSEECVKGIIEVIESNEVPFIILEKILEEVKERITSSIVIKK